MYLFDILFYILFLKAIIDSDGILPITFIFTLELYFSMIGCIFGYYHM